VHREENVDNPANLEKIIAVLEEMQNEYKQPVIVSTHPRARKRLEARKNKVINDQIQFLKPFGFIDYIHLQQKCKLHGF